MECKFKEVLDKDSIIVFDTNVYLNLYEYSPEVADIFIEEIYCIEKEIFIPSTVKREFFKNHKQCSGRQKKKFRNVSKELKKYTEKASYQLNKQLNVLEKFQFPGIKQLRTVSIQKLSEIESIFDEYLEQHDVYEEINKMFLKQDKILDLFKGILNEKRVFQELSVNEIYDICAEGKNRYYKEIPPGFQDGKNKDGIEKYNDLIIWKEVIKYCKDNNKNLIFVTDDVKKDWWNREGENITFHKRLIEEFKGRTNREILPLTSQQLYEILANMYNISVPDTIQNILVYNVDSYINNLIDDYDLIDEIQSICVNSEDRYVNIETLSNYDGSYFELNDEFDEINLLNCSFEEYEDNIAIYTATFEVKITATSRVYWCRDEDTREIILSSNHYIHTLSGELNVTIKREIEDYHIYDIMNNIINDNYFSEVEINYGELDEIGVIDSDSLCVQCGKNIGVIPFGHYGMVCEECAVGDEYGEICPSCGKKVPHEDMAGNGFCIECTNKSDYL